LFLKNNADLRIDPFQERGDDGICPRHLRHRIKRINSQRVDQELRRLDPSEPVWASH